MPTAPTRPRWSLWSCLILVLGLGPIAAPEALGQSSTSRAKSKASSKAADKVKGKPAEKSAKSADEAAEKEPPDEPDAKPETDGEDDTDEDTKSERRPGLFGDTKRFSKVGGWGSIGGTMGQWGMARSVLIMMPPVQEELKLTDRQKAQIKEWLEGMRERGEEMGRRMREQGGDPGAQEDVPITTRIFQFTRMMNQVGELLQENETGLGRILDKRQRTRLTQISLQMEGIAAVTRPEVAQAINLGPDQLELIQQYLAQSRLMQMTTWIERGVAMSRRFRPNGRPEPGSTPPPSGNPETAGRQSPTREPARGGEGPRDRESDAARAARGKAMQKEFEAMRDRTDSIQEQSVRQILKVLTRRQRASFEKLLGEPFDPSRINEMGRRPGRPGDPPAQPSSGRGSGLPPSNQGASR